MTRLSSPRLRFQHHLFVCRLTRALSKADHVGQLTGFAQSCSLPSHPSPKNSVRILYLWRTPAFLTLDRKNIALGAGIDFLILYPNWQPPGCWYQHAACPVFRFDNLGHNLYLSTCNTEQNTAEKLESHLDSFQKSCAAIISQAQPYCISPQHKQSEKFCNLDITAVLR